MTEVAEFAKAGGYVFGVCNGFQVLCEAGLLPGALLANTARKFSCKNVYLTSQNDNTAITKTITKGKVLNVPIAHGEGRFYADKATLEGASKILGASASGRVPTQGGYNRTRCSEKS